MLNEKYTVKYHPTIDKELLQIAKYYYGIGGRALADRMVDGVIAALDDLEFMPEDCEAIDVKRNIRKKTIKKPPYIAYYAVDRDNKLVYVLRLVHGSRDQAPIRSSLIR